jgi:hypothetical protein
MLQLENLLLIESFYDNEKDRELVRLAPFLKYLNGINDIRPVFKKKMSFDSKEIYIKPTSRRTSASTIESSSASPTHYGK